MRGVLSGIFLCALVSGAEAQTVDLSGAYAGVMVSRATGWEFNEWTRPHWARQQFYYWPPSTREEQSMDWWSGSLLAGYNWMNGTSLIGLEARISTGLSTAGDEVREFHVTPDSNYVNSWGLAWSDTSKLTNHQEFRLIAPHEIMTNFRSEYSIREVASPDLSVRFGRQFGNVLLFMKLGGGVSVVEETRTFDDSGSTYCNLRYLYRDSYAGGGFQDYPSPCLAVSSGLRTSQTSTRVLPTVLAGVGAEYHWERMFVRGEAELRAVIDNELDFQPESSTSSYVRFGLGVGYKF